MRLDSIAINSLKRRKTKLLFMVLGMVIAVGSVVALHSLTAAMNRELAATFDEIGANIIVKPNTADYAVSYGGVSIPSSGEEALLSSDDIIKINTIPNRDNIAFVAPKLLGMAEYQKEDVVLVGVDFQYELKLKKWWRFQGEKPLAVNHLLLGSKVASKFNKQPGDKMKINDREFTVAAVLEEQGSDEDGIIFAHILTAQEVLNKKNKVSFIEVAAYCTSCPIEQIIAEIEKALPHARVTALAEAVQLRQQTIDRLSNFAYFFSILVTLIGSVLIMLTMLSAVSERVSEIGIYRAMGYRRSNILEIILTEAAVIGLIGGALGYVLGISSSRLLAPIVAEMQISISWNPLVGVTVILFAVIIGILASVYPAVKASQIDPVEAFRFI